MSRSRSAPVLLLLAYGVVFFLHRFVYQGLTGPQGDGGVLYAAAWALRAGIDPWDAGVLRTLAVDLGVTWDAAAGLGPEFWGDTQNANPPGLLVLLLPWTLLPVGAAVPVLAVANTAAAGASVLLARRLLMPAAALAWLALVLATYTPLYRAQVQITLPLLAAFLGGCLLWRHGRLVWAGVCLSALLFRPPLGALVLLVLLWLRQWRAAGAMAAIGVVLTLAAVPFVGVDALTRYFGEHVPAAASAGVNTVGGGADWNLSTLRFLFAAVGMDAPLLAAAAAALLVLVTLAVIRRTGDLVLPLSLVMLVAMLGAYSRDYYHLLALPLLVWLAVPGLPKRELALLALVYAALAYESYFPQPVIRAYKPAALLALWGYGCIVARRQMRYTEGA